MLTDPHAVTRIIELCHEGLIERHRRWGCGKWFYAKFSHQKFCSDVCQLRIYKASPEWKAYRRDYMKRNRAMHKQRIFR